MELLNLFDITIETAILIALITIVNRLLRHRLDPNIRYFLWIFVAVRLLVPIRVELAVETPALLNHMTGYFQDSQTAPADMAEVSSASEASLPTLTENIAGSQKADGAADPTDIAAANSANPANHMSGNPADITAANSANSANHMAGNPADIAAASSANSANHTAGNPADNMATNPVDIMAGNLENNTATSPTKAVQPLQRLHTPQESAMRKPAISGKAAALLVWLSGMAVLSGYVLINNGRVFLSFRQKRREIKVLDNGIPLYAMPGYNCLAGILSPAIYIDIEAFDDSKVIQDVISHELSHYRVRDNYWQLLRVICLVLQWHNPFMWWAYFASKRDCEMACDARVVRDMTSEERYGYGNSLLMVAGALCRKRQQAYLCSTSMGGSKSFMKERIRGIMQYKYKHAVVLLTAIICIIGLGCFISVHLYASAQKNPEPALDISSGSPDDYEGIAATADLQPELGDVMGSSPQEEITPMTVNVADYYITRTGNPSNLYIIDENNVLWGCGRNNCGQLGQGTQDYDFHEDKVKIAENVIHVDYSQNEFIIYLTEDHKLYGVGNAGCGALQQYEAFDPMQYANSEHYTVTTPCLLMENVVYARCGRSDVACMTEDSEIWVFGTIGFDRSEICYSQYPVKVLENAAFVTGGFFHHAALLQDGSVWTWGYNYAGGCGVPDDEIVSTPVKVAEHVQMVWTEDPEYRVRYDNIADFDGVYERQLQNTIILTDEGEYLICGAYVGTEEKLLPIYYEAIDYSLIFTHEFRPYMLPIQAFTLEETAVVPEIKEYDFRSAMEAGTAWQIRGMLPGMGEGTWYTIAIDGVEYYYGHYDFQEDEDAQFFAYAIFSDKYSLINGLSVGMTVEEVLEKYPDMAITNFYGEQLGNLRMSGITDGIGWNQIAYPRSYFGMDDAGKYDDGKDYAWSDQFDYIMFAEIDQEADTLPVCVGLMVSGNVVAAITFFYPTAG